MLAINTGGGWRIAGEADYIFASENGFAVSELFTRSAPAADLAGLVPDAIQLEPGHSPYVDEFHAAGWNACRAEMLRNIEEAK